MANELSLEDFLKKKTAHIGGMPLNCAWCVRAKTHYLLINVDSECLIFNKTMSKVI